MIGSFGWVADGVNYSERDTLETLERMIRIAARYGTAARALLDMAWIADGVSDSEVMFIYGLHWRLGSIAFDDEEAVSQVIGMPFLQTLEATDETALNSLRGMDSDQLADMLSRPMLKDGITDDEAPIVSMLFDTLDLAPGLVDTLLDPDATTVERRTVDLSLAGEVDLAIVRTRPGARRSMDLLENAVREAENLMGEPFPKSYVGLLYENAVARSYSGWNLGTHMAIRPRSETNRHLLAHEVARYYWSGNAHWIDEGMAELTASAIENRRVGTPIVVTNSPCKSARSIAESETLRSEDAFFNCDYYLGESLFVSLLRTLGEDAFWEGARSLYAASRDAGIGIKEVRQAFGADAEDVIARWYDGE